MPATVIVGLQWGELTNANLGATESITYTVSCGEVPAVNSSRARMLM